MRRRTFRNVMALFIVILLLSFTIYASAQTAEQLLRNPNLTNLERNAIAKAIAQSGSPTSLPTTIKGMLEWKEMGEAFAITIERICKTLNVEVNAFLKSDVGMLTASVIVYKMVGKDILRIILYTGIWLGITFFMMCSIKFLHMKKKIKQKVLDPDDESKKSYTLVYDYVERFNWGGSDEGQIAKVVSLFAHIIAWFILSCIIAYNVI